MWPRSVAVPVDDDRGFHSGGRPGLQLRVVRFYRPERHSVIGDQVRREKTEIRGKRRFVLEFEHGADVDLSSSCLRLQNVDVGHGDGCPMGVEVIDG